MPPDFLSDFTFVLFLVDFYSIILSSLKPTPTKFDFIFIPSLTRYSHVFRLNKSFNITNKFQITPSFKLIL